MKNKYLFSIIINTWETSSIINKKRKCDDQMLCISFGKLLRFLKATKPKMHAPKAANPPKMYSGNTFKLPSSSPIAPVYTGVAAA